MIWGALNGLWMIPALLRGKQSGERPSDVPGGEGLLPTPRAAFEMLRTFAAVCATWVFFRAATFHDAMTVFRHGIRDLFSPPGYAAAADRAAVRARAVPARSRSSWRSSGCSAGTRYGLELPWPRPVRWAAYTACIWLCVLRMPNDVPTFIYFQF